MSNPEDFTVGWISALSIERTAARAFLDEELPGLESVPINDDNTYLLGIMGQHRVVIASLPDGEYGVSSATGVVRDMVHTFYNLRFVLMVGIAGGAPTPDQPIRVGDIVVSKPTDGHGGVFQYDFGKTIQTQEFQNTSYLNRPPRVLLTALSGLKGDHKFHGHDIEQKITQALEKNPRLLKEYSKPPIESDRLYRSSFVHPYAVKGRCAELCGDKPEDVIMRQPRGPHDNDPEVFYGLVASANNLMKDALLRDKLAEEKYVLCFEMEAAGLMNQFPSLTIRGICDYSDTHKNEDWQGYAAMTAAAYAKELLSRVTPKRVQGIQKIVDIFRETAQEAREYYRKDLQLQEQQVTYHVKAEHRALLEALKVCNYESFKDRNPQRQAGTCNWIRKHARFCSWRDNPGSDLLWISADPGCGKSVLAKAFVDDRDFFTPPDGAIVCYFFFKDNDEQNSLATALCALLHQLFAQQPKLLDSAMDSWQKNGTKLCQDERELWRMFLKASIESTVGPVICIIDALDECKDQDRNKLLQNLKDLHANMTRPGLSANQVKVVITSRPYDDLVRVLDSVPGIRLRGEDENEELRLEINLVVTFRVRELGKEFSISSEVQHDLEQRLLNMEHRTYLWLYLAIDSIWQLYKKSWDHKGVVIDDLPSSVQDAYEKMLNGIKENDDQRARRVLGVIVCARRAFTIQELKYALGVAERDETCDLDSARPDMSDSQLKDWIRHYCGLFVYFNDDIIYLIHQTAKDFLLQSERPSKGVWSWSFSYHEVEELMATICVKALCSQEIHHDSMEYDVYHMLSDPKRDFLEYCTLFWMEHIGYVYEQMSTSYAKQLDALHDFDPSEDKPWFKFFWESTEYEETPRLTSFLSCAFTGYLGGLRRGLEEGKRRLLQSDSDGNNALHWASHRGHQNAIKLLVQSGASIDAQNHADETALIRASTQGHFQIVLMLLDKGANVNAQGGHYGSALQAASCNGHIELVQMLLRKGANINAQGGHYGSALQAASWNGHIELVQMLLHKGANVNAQGGHYGSALQAASERSHIELIQMLLHKGANINAQGGHYGSALQAASWNGRIELVQMLLHKGANVNAQGGHYGNALQAASLQGYLKVAKELLHNGANINAQGGYHGSALQAASERSHIELIQMLLHKGANINAQGGRYGNALQAASWNGRIELVQMLLHKGANINAQGGHYGNALQAASSQGRYELVQVLLHKGANVNAQGGHYGSALQAAAATRCNSEEIVRLLLEYGAIKAGGSVEEEEKRRSESRKRKRS